jgi:hypothetical protein
MKLTQKALDAIKEKKLYSHLSIALGVSAAAIYRYVATNDDNLTKAASIQCLKKETGLGDEDLLEAEMAS